VIFRSHTQADLTADRCEPTLSLLTSPRMTCVSTHADDEVAELSRDVQSQRAARWLLSLPLNMAVYPPCAIAEHDEPHIYPNPSLPTTSTSPPTAYAAPIPFIGAVRSLSNFCAFRSFSSCLHPSNPGHS